MFMHFVGKLKVRDCRKCDRIKIYIKSRKHKASYDVQNDFLPNSHFLNNILQNMNFYSFHCIRCAFSSYLKKGERKKVADTAETEFDGIRPSGQVQFL